eukprot:gb/GECG01013670.1/.p1 GENE.gb/GECG01013670.1/~~gb/GECG01013670.1/.p1  ORF type:complete len:353 (+),score=37.41 gb/GECG01013670.1/:1-1059(+)
MPLRVYAPPTSLTGTMAGRFLFGSRWIGPIAAMTAAGGGMAWTGGRPNLFAPSVSYASEAPSTFSVEWQGPRQGPCKNQRGIYNIVLYQYEVCPFCNKVKAYLDYHGIPYTAVEVNPLTKREMRWSKDYKMVPFAVVNGIQVRGSSEIIDYLENEMKVQQTSHNDEQVEKWYQWVDDKLVRKLAPNIYRTWNEAKESFEYISENSAMGNSMNALVTRYVGAVGMYAISKRLCKKHGIERGGEREALYEDINTWLNAVRNNDGNAEEQPYKFLGGKYPNKADLAVYGVLRSLEGYRTWEDACNNTDIKRWFSMMEQAVGERNCSLAHTVGVQARGVYKQANTNTGGDQETQKS